MFLHSPECWKPCFVWNDKWLFPRPEWTRAAYVECKLALVNNWKFPVRFWPVCLIIWCNSLVFLVLSTKVRNSTIILFTQMSRPVSFQLKERQQKVKSLYNIDCSIDNLIFSQSWKTKLGSRPLWPLSWPNDGWYLFPVWCHNTLVNTVTFPACFIYFYFFSIW